jgi:hypothetical protein
MPTTRRADTATATQSRLGRKLAALAGATGAVTAGTAEAVPYTPTADVAVAQNITGFSFVSDTDVTLGDLRPPASAGFVYWDIDGDGGDDFYLRNVNNYAIFGPQQTNNAMIGQRGEGVTISNLATGMSVGLAGPWQNSLAYATVNGTRLEPGLQNFSTNVSGQFGFRFTSGSDTFYGWGSLVPDLLAPGQGFKITEAYYHSTPGTAIDVGAVPVPEPSSMVLLALGAAGLTAWRARRGQAG